MIRSGVTIRETVQIGPGVIIDDSLILKDTTPNPGAVVTDCVVGANTTIGANAPVPVSETTTIEGGAIVDDRIEVGSRPHG